MGSTGSANLRYRRITEADGFLIPTDNTDVRPPFKRRVVHIGDCRGDLHLATVYVADNSICVNASEIEASVAPSDIAAQIFDVVASSKNTDEAVAKVQVILSAALSAKDDEIRRMRAQVTRVEAFADKIEADTGLGGNLGTVTSAIAVEVRRALNG